ncbi:hypothetical protein ACPEIF_12130 [Streptomyces sp. NPDC012600]|uniref:hypothetical protein n=1 Tax=Streptomyces sp. NPDC012600 TaxID=3415005 RepID=UPI003C2ECB16
MIDLGYSRSSRQSCRVDRKCWVLENIPGAVLREIESLAVEDAQRKADEERVKAKREVRWQATMKKAKGLASTHWSADWKRRPWKMRRRWPRRAPRRAEPRTR